MSEEEEDDFEVEDMFFISRGNSQFIQSIYNMVETLIETDIYQATVEQSMETYNEELFRKREGVRLLVPPHLLTKSELDQMKTPKCFICLENFSIKESVVKLPCTHIFHHDCVEGAIHHQHSKCPLCRQTIPLKEEEINQDGHRVTLG